MKRSLLTVVMAFALLVGGGSSVFAAGPDDGAGTAAAPHTTTQPYQPTTRDRSVPAERRGQVLGRVSADDRAWTTYGDLDGLHVLTAVAADGFAWHGVTTLSEPGFEGDTWLGHGCLVGDGRTAVITYAPRMFTNKPDFFGRGGFVATVDLVSGKVTKLPVTSSLSYFTPSCGSGLDAVVTQEGGEKVSSTRLIRIHAGRGKVDPPVQVRGQLTSAVPLKGSGFVAAGSGALVAVDTRGRTTVLAPTAQSAFDLAVDGRSRLVYLDRDQNTSTAHELQLPKSAAAARRTPVRRLASGPLTKSGVARTAHGRVILLGQLAVTGALPDTVEAKPEASKDAQPSSNRGLLVEGARAVAGRTDPDLQTRPVQVDAVSGVSGERVDLAVAAEELTDNPSTERSPVLQQLTASSGSPTAAAESERTCSVPRNDPRSQALQPKPRQVEWAVDQAVRGALTVQRPANWKNLGMPAYTPQGLFPSKPLAGGGNVPAQIFLGILAQESNLWQAPGNVTPGVTGNPLIGNYYGLQISTDSESPDHDWNVKWTDADCGYGVAQVTDGMRLAGKTKSGEKAFAYQTQRAVALDYAANVAAGLTILQDKWNQVAAAGLTVNNNDPQFLENWFYAIWAYNTGFYPKSDVAKNDGAWGLGWANNPVNPRYPVNRASFLDTTFFDATHPEDWPYPEKVLGFAGHPIDLLESPNTYVSAYRAAWWSNSDLANGAVNRMTVKPPVNQFCDASNDCFPGTSHTGGASGVAGANAGPCAHKNAAGQYDLKCWYHQSTRWKSDCPSQCGHEQIRFVPGYAYQDDGTAYPPNCTTAGLPSGALVIDDQPDSYTSVRPGCSRGYTSAGSFSLSFGADSAGNYPSKIDFHQLGAGFNGHFWYAHTRTKELRSDSMRVTGTWVLGKTLNQWARVMVHLPDIGAQTQEANYIVNLGNGQRSRVILQRRRSNAWVSLGVFPFAGTPKVSLSSTTYLGDGPQRTEIRNEDIAFDAVAVQPLSAKPKDIVVSLGDSYSSGEGSSTTDGANFYPETDSVGAGGSTRNLCHRSKLAWSRQAQLAGASATIGSSSDSWSPLVEHDLLACSGAVTDNVLSYWTTPTPLQRDPSHTGQYAELPQLDRGFVDADTTLVTLSIGGNDARFAAVVGHCVQELTAPCQDTPLPPPRESDPPSTEPASSEVPRLIKGPVVRGVTNVLAEIHLRAPKAKIVLMGYPEVLEPGQECAGAPLVSGYEAAWIASMADLMDDTLKSTASTFNTSSGSTVVYAADPRVDFAGHGVCSSTPGIRGFTLATTPAEGNAAYSSQSFHPNATGQQYYASTLNRALRQLGR